jgi:hypothetical protein
MKNRIGRSERRRGIVVAAVRAGGGGERRALRCGLVDFVDVGRVRGLRFFRKGAVSEPKQRFHISRRGAGPREAVAA